MSAKAPTIIYTLTDEAPALATAAFLPIVRAFAAPAGEVGAQLVRGFIDARLAIVQCDVDRSSHVVLRGATALVGRRRARMIRQFFGRDRDVAHAAG